MSFFKTSFPSSAGLGAALVSGLEPSADDGAGLSTALVPANDPPWPASC